MSKDRKSGPKPKRCDWASVSDLMSTYHDAEWGVPERDSRRLWEHLVLETFQAGLSWHIILKKRAAFQAAFAEFDPQAIARFDAADIERLAANPLIVRSRKKIRATIINAHAYCRMQETGETFSSFAWQFTQGSPLIGDGGPPPSKTQLSELLSQELKHRGFTFVGPTVTYAWMQATGIINDHQKNCFRRLQLIQRSI